MPPVLGAILAIAGNLGISAAVLAFAFKVVVAFAISAVANAVFGPKAPKGAVLKDRSITIREPTAARRVIYGQVRVGGVIVFIDTTSNNKYLHLVIAFASHEVESFDGFYLNDELLTVTSNIVTAPSQYANKCEIYTASGTDGQGAQPELVSRSSLWGLSHRLRGIAYAYVRLQYDRDAYPSGIPNITALISGKKVYDPRTGTTVYSNNAALCAADYLMDQRLGLGIPLASINSTVLTTAANTCEEAVTLLATGTEDRYTCNGVVDIDTTPKAIIEGLNTAKAAPTVYNMGSWYIHAGSYKTPTVSLDDDNLAGGLQVSTRQPRSELFNAVKGVYVSPDNDWQLSDYPVVEGSTYYTEDNNELIWREIDLPFTTSAATAQRIALLRLNQSRRQISCKATFNLTAMDVIPADVIQLSVDHMGWVNKTFEVIDWQFAITDGNALAIDLTLRETDSSIYTWSTANESAANAAPQTNLPNFAVVALPTNMSATSYQIPTAGGDETVKVYVEWTAPADEYVIVNGYIEIQYRESTDTAWRPSWRVDGGVEKAEIPQLEYGLTYDVRIRASNRFAKSGWLQLDNILVLGSGTIGSSEDWGDWVAAVSTTEDWGGWTAAVDTTEDWENWA